MKIVLQFLNEFLLRIFPELPSADFSRSFMSLGEPLATALGVPSRDFFMNSFYRYLQRFLLRIPPGIDSGNFSRSGFWGFLQ